MRKILYIFLVVLSVGIICSSVYAGIVGTDKVTVTEPTTGSIHGDINTTTKNAWKTITTIVQILSAACVVFVGLRYMFASADQKADIKKGLIYLFVGAFIVFGATSIIKMIAASAESIID